ncbi:hypothetical protein BD779DRAFT_1559352 [Infundibulicybe gibba]|nr:hypothetical protein BD779DRAFT_1559352 [Infundibulicybe gibba]
MGRCFNALGRAWVRHPSYSALFLVVLGEAAVICAPGMWLFECGTLRGAGFVVLTLWYGGRGTEKGVRT